MAAALRQLPGVRPSQIVSDKAREAAERNRELQSYIAGDNNNPSIFYHLDQTYFTASVCYRG